MMKNKTRIVVLISLLFVMSVISLNSSVVYGQEIVWLSRNTFEDAGLNAPNTVYYQLGNEPAEQLFLSDDGYYMAEGATARYRAHSHPAGDVYVLSDLNSQRVELLPNQPGLQENVGDVFTQKEVATTNGGDNNGDGDGDTTNGGGTTELSNGDDDDDDVTEDARTALDRLRDALSTGAEDGGETQTRQCTSPSCREITIGGETFETDGRHIYIGGERISLNDENLRDHASAIREAYTIRLNAPSGDLSPADQREDSRYDDVYTDDRGRQYIRTEKGYVDIQTGNIYDSEGAHVDVIDGDELQDARKEARDFNVFSEYQQKPFIATAQNLGNGLHNLARVFDRVFDTNIAGGIDEFTKNIRAGYIEFRAKGLEDASLLRGWIAGREGLSIMCLANQWGGLGMMDHRDLDPTQSAVCNGACVQLNVERIDHSDVSPLNDNRYTYIISYLVQAPSCSDKCGECDSWAYDIVLYNEDEEFTYLSQEKVGFGCDPMSRRGTNPRILQTGKEYTHARIIFAPGTNLRNYIRGYYDNNDPNIIQVEILLSDRTGISPDTVPTDDDDDDDDEDSSSGNQEGTTNTP